MRALLALTLIAATATPTVRVLDGDTIVINGEHIRLLGIDAPEMPGHCAEGRDCTPGDPFAAKAALEADIDHAALIVVRINTDHYGRTVADVLANGQSLSCLQLRSGHARYWRRFDNSLRIRSECPDAAK